MNEEIQLLKSQNTWEYTYPPKDVNIIDTHFIYKIKRLVNESIEKYKARLVVQEYAQKDKIDFYSNDLFALVTRITIVRLLLSWAAFKDYKIHQINVKSTYLYDELNNDEQIYIKPP